MNANGFFITEMGFQQKSPSVLFEDNGKRQSIYQRIQCFMITQSTLTFIFHSSYERVQNGDISVLHCLSDWMVADTMMKALL